MSQAVSLMTTPLHRSMSGGYSSLSTPLHMSTGGHSTMSTPLHSSRVGSNSRQWKTADRQERRFGEAGENMRRRSARAGRGTVSLASSPRRGKKQGTDGQKKIKGLVKNKRKAIV